MEPPDAEVECRDVLPFWNLICRLECNHKDQHFGDNGTDRAGYWGRGVIHVERVVTLQPA